MTRKKQPASEGASSRLDKMQDAGGNVFVAAYIKTLGNKLATGASAYYRQKFNLGLADWSAMMAIGRDRTSIAREIADLADLDYGAASKSLKLLQERGLVESEPAGRRGRAVRLTRAGLDLYDQIFADSVEREHRLLQGFTDEDVGILWTLLRRLDAGVVDMNRASG